ncbi:hypothetical protein Hamer_G005507 [Homarus americanus]|uniref:Uncharacterized protein n=1 Tax=Homarus americanus TaxID=6706 RepID=A0A8J5JZC4_HOMAM|nr:hypothetical protein Hamer_G005507 [Homarus americanus]
MSQQLCGITGEFLVLKGSLDISIKLGGKEEARQIYVADIANPNILGLDNLLPRKCQLDLVSVHLKIKGKWVPLRTEKHKLPALLIACRSAGYTPVKLMLGHELRLPVDLLTGRPLDQELPEETTIYVKALQKRLTEVHHQVRGALEFSGAVSARAVHLGRLFGAVTYHRRGPDRRSWKNLGPYRSGEPDHGPGKEYRSLLPELDVTREGDHFEEVTEVAAPWEDFENIPVRRR